MYLHLLTDEDIRALRKSVVERLTDLIWSAYESGAKTDEDVLGYVRNTLDVSSMELAPIIKEIHAKMADNLPLSLDGSDGTM